MKKAKTINPADKKKIVTALKRGTAYDKIVARFPQYNRYQLGAIKQHVVKGNL